MHLCVHFASIPLCCSIDNLQRIGFTVTLGGFKYNFYCMWCPICFTVSEVLFISIHFSIKYSHLCIFFFFIVFTLSMTRMWQLKLESWDANFLTRISLLFGWLPICVLLLHVGRTVTVKKKARRIISEASRCNKAAYMEKRSDHDDKASQPSSSSRLTSSRSSSSAAAKAFAKAEACTCTSIIILIKDNNWHYSLLYL